MDTLDLTILQVSRIGIDALVPQVAHHIKEPNYQVLAPQHPAVVPLFGLQEAVNAENESAAQTSHAALGPLAAQIVAEHPLQSLFGEQTPIGKLYQLDGHVLLLGVDHGNNTVLHLAEERAQFSGK